MSSRCKVCNSPHRMEYEEWYLKEPYQQIKVLWRRAVSKYQESFSYEAFRRHMKFHVDAHLKLRKAVDRERKLLYEKIVKQDIYIAERLMQNFGILASQIQGLMDKGLVDIQDHKLLLDYLGECRLLMEQILRWKDKLEVDITETGEKLMNKLLYIVDFLCPKCQIIIKEKLEELSE